MILAVQTPEQARARSAAQPGIVVVCRDVCDAGELGFAAFVAGERVERSVSLREAIAGGKCRLNQLPLPLGVLLEGVAR